MRKKDNQETSDGFAWGRLFLGLQALLFVLLLNPWSKSLRWTAIILFSVEALFFIGWGFPVFLYTFLVKRKSLSESWRAGIRAVVNLISFTWWF